MGQARKGASADPRHDLERRARWLRRANQNDRSGVALSRCAIARVVCGDCEGLNSSGRATILQCLRERPCVHLKDWRLTRSGTALSRTRTSITAVLSLRVVSARTLSSSPLVPTRMLTVAAPVASHLFKIDAEAWQVHRLFLLRAAEWLHLPDRRRCAALRNRSAHRGNSTGLQASWLPFP